MEALAIFGIACNVMQVIGSAEQAIKLIKKIHESGTVNPDLVQTAHDLDVCVADLKKSLDEPHGSIISETTEIITIAKNLLDTTTKIRTELQKVDTFRPRESRRGAVRAWLSAATGGKRKLDELEKELRAQQRVLDTKLLVRIW